MICMEESAVSNEKLKKRDKFFCVGSVCRSYDIIVDTNV